MSDIDILAYVKDAIASERKMRKESWIANYHEMDRKERESMMNTIENLVGLDDIYARFEKVDSALLSFHESEIREAFSKDFMHYSDWLKMDELSKTLEILSRD